ncbi:MAG: lycopene cyclase domain-containing protein [Flavobacteriaceae bacterium]|nr:lycopene cyclase domain-containing protein [Flavobacteriaceae bacterium]
MEKYLYLTIDLLTLFVPFVASFYSKHAYYKNWSSLFKGIAIVGLFFLVWDAYFTHIAVWGFNERYLTGIKVFNLPLEEVLFFICIPYSSVFVYFSMEYLLKKNPLEKSHKLITNFLLTFSIVVFLLNYNKWYTASTFGLLALYMLFHLYRKTYLGRHYVSYTITLVFFFIVNGILTGSFIDEPVVWYNDAENLGIRIGTIPFEDAFYGFLLIAGIIDWFDYFRIKK